MFAAAGWNFLGIINKKCPICGEKARSRKKNKRHMKEKHGEDINNWSTVRVYEEQEERPIV